MLNPSYCGWNQMLTMRLYVISRLILRDLSPVPITHSMACSVICISAVCSWDCVWYVCLMSIQPSCILSSRLDAWVRLNHLKLLQFIKSGDLFKSLRTYLFYWVCLLDCWIQPKLLHFIKQACCIICVTRNYCDLLSRPTVLSGSLAISEYDFIIE